MKNPGAIWCAGLALGLLSLLGLPGQAEPAKKTLILGVDGLDPKLMQQFVDEGVLPNFERLLAQSDFRPLQTTMPPLSPIAWSTFITGMDPGGHAIFDFIRREPDTIHLDHSMAMVRPSSWRLKVGSWCPPLRGGEALNLREGPAWWQILEERDVPTTVFRMPANFPPVESSGKAFSGMGTPDIQGTPGTFTFYTNRLFPNAADVSGGRIEYVKVVDDTVAARLYGPANDFRCVPKETRGRPRGDAKPETEHPEITVDFDVFLDPEQPLARIVVQDTEIILREGEWSDWVPMDFEAVPLLASVSAIGRFYLKQARPDFMLYVTPLQINPESPALPVSTPSGWSRELWKDLGYFYTQELPEDTKALTHGVFDGHEFWEQSQFVFRERRDSLDYFLKNFEEGVLFFYFSSIDQGCHMLWRWADSEHPAFEQDTALKDGIRTLYRQLDTSLGKVMAAIDDETTLIVMSDHGFAPFYWQVELNSWLLEKGYVTLKNPAIRGKYPLFINVDWSRTRAYAVGLNGIYVNLAGREKQGIVQPGEEYEALIEELERDLLAMRDPRNEQQPVSLVVRTQRDFHGPHTVDGPDIIVGYNWGYRSAWKSPLGEFPPDLFTDNLDAWSGDHAMDYRLVPGVLISNRKITLDEPALYDLTVAILDEYGVAKLPEMIGQDCLGAPLKAATGTAQTGLTEESETEDAER